MLKNLSILGAVLLLAACSTEETVEQKPKVPLDNNTSSVDPSTGYESPFDGVLLSSSVPHNIQNLTDELTLDFNANIGLAYYDGYNDGIHFGINLHAFNAVNLFANNDEYLNMVKATTNTVFPNDSYVVNSGQCPVIINGQIVPAPHYFDVFANTEDAEVGILYEYGRVYTIDYRIKNVNNLTIKNSSIKVRFVDDAYDANSNPFWHHGGLVSGTNQEFLYHDLTGEIVFANSKSGTPSIEYFDYNGAVYYITAFTTKHEFKLILAKVE